jgi:hypothetical protein
LPGPAPGRPADLAPTVVPDAGAPAIIIFSKNINYQKLFSRMVDNLYRKIIIQFSRFGKVLKSPFLPFSLPNNLISAAI